MARTQTCLAAALLAACSIATAVAQTPPPSSTTTVPRTAAVRASDRIVLDGRLDEPDWQRVRPATGFVQRDPDEGRPASDATEVRILYDDSAIYVGARMYDREPAKISRRLTRRDGDTDGIADWITIAFDAHHDHLTGAMFTVTAAGSLGDGVLFNDSDDDDTWDAVWEAEVSIDEQGWIAEMRIPLSQLRFPAAERQVWGMHAVRYVQRTNEETWWALVPKNASGIVSLMGEVEGLDGIRPRRHLELLPYATARGEASGTAAGGDRLREFVADAGLDMKWGFTSNLTMDATFNPDFGQVEVDPAVVNLSAFETFFEEKRPFFIEGSQAFDRFGRNGASGYLGFNRSNPTLFYSRRIGRAPQGALSGPYVTQPSATTILGAAKVSGKTSNGWTLNLIDAVTAREWATSGIPAERVEVEPLTNYFAARVRRDLGQRAGFGMLTTLVHRDAGDARLDSIVGSSAVVVGGDGHLFLTPARDYVITGSLSASRVAGSTAALSRLQRSSTRYFQRPDATHIAFDPGATTLSGWNLQLDFNKNNGGIRPNASFWAVSPGFEVNDVGFATSADRTGGHAALVLLKPTPDRFTRERTLILAKWNVWNFARDLLGDGYFAEADATFRNYWSAELRLHGGRAVLSDRLTRGGPLMRGPGFVDVSAELRGDERKPVVWSVEGSYETRTDTSWSGSGEVSFEMKPMPAVTVDVGPEFTRERNETQYVRTFADHAATETFGARYVFGALDQTELSMDTRVSVILSPRMSLQLYVQPLISVGRYNDFAQAARPRTSTFTRFGRDAGSLQYFADANAYVVDPGDGGQRFTFRNPDFNVRALRVNAVYRWEVRPGSTLYVVWTQQREDEVDAGRFDLSNDLSRLWRASSDNVFMVKMSYWFAR